MARNLYELLGRPSMEEAFEKEFMLHMVGEGSPREYLVFAARSYAQSMTERVAPLRVSKGLTNQVEAARQLDIDSTSTLVKAAEIATFEGRQKIGKFGGASEIIIQLEEKIAVEAAKR